MPSPSSATTHRARSASVRPRGPRVRPLPGPARRLLGNPLLEALATPHGMSRFLETVHPLWTLEGGRALVTDVRPETADVTTLTLQPDHAWEGVRAGQHVRIGVPIDGTLRTRTYSVSSSAHRDDGCLTITVKRKDGGLVSGHLTTATRRGDVLHCSPATGDVVLPDPRPSRLLLVSGGSGITPVMSMLRTLVDEGHVGRVTFLHYARTSADVPFAAELHGIADACENVEVVVATTAETNDAPLHGRFRPSHLTTLVPDHLEVPTFACGPTGLVDAVEQVYAAAGADDRLHVERFTPPALVRPDVVAGGTVRFARSDIEVVDDGRSILEQAEAAGLEPANGCRMGICHTCTRLKPAGTVTDLRTGRASDAPDEHVQICVSVPAGDVVLDL